jgi:outer membrane protein OmpU
MNKLTKVGCSALCGSLAAISAANAGDLTVTGGATMTWVSISGAGAGPNGNPLGMASAVTFKGSGELDNGWTFALSIAEGDKSAYSSSNIDIVMGGLGSLNFDQGDSGNGIAAYDNVMPTAWEEPYGAGLGGHVKTVLGSGASNNVMYTTPTILGTTVALTYAHAYGVTDTADKTAKANNTNNGRSMDATVKINPSFGSEILSGLNLYAGASIVERYDNGATIEDAYEAVAAVTFDLGPVSLGYMASGLYDGDEGLTDKYHTYKNKGFGIAFNVNDDFSVSYGEYESRKAGYKHQENTSQPDNSQRIVHVSSFQAAYTMGGATFSIADVAADNVGFAGASDQKATIVSLGLAF